MDVLVVEGEPQVRRAVAEGLRAAGLTVVAAACAEAALTAVAAADGPPPVLVADLTLPLGLGGGAGGGAGGPALAAVLRRRRPDLGVVYLARHLGGLLGRRLGARERGLTGPFPPRKLARLIRTVRDLMPAT
jgi:CheY-like chemotaxis protein